MPAGVSMAPDRGRTLASGAGKTPAFHRLTAPQGIWDPAILSYFQTLVLLRNQACPQGFPRRGAAEPIVHDADTMGLDRQRGSPPGGHQVGPRHRAGDRGSPGCTVPPAGGPRRGLPNRVCSHTPHNPADGRTGSGIPGSSHPMKLRSQPSPHSG